MSRFVVATLMLLALVSPSRAQGTTGLLIGTVRDASGGVLPGAAAKVSSPALIGGGSVRVTNEKGQYRFGQLPPGSYRLEVELSGFATFVEEDIRIEVNGTVARTVTLELAGLEETIVVSGKSPIVDTRTAGYSTNFGTDVLESTPLRRVAVYQITKSAPGMAATRPSGLGGGVSAFGSSVNENLYLLDGTNTTSSWSGGPAPLPDPEVVQEIEIRSMGTSAEYGNMQGAVINVVTKQGGNDVRFDASYYFQTQAY